MYCRQLTKENQRLSELCAQEATQKKRLILYNEELLYKLKHNSEVVTLLQGQSPSRKLHEISQSSNDDSLHKTSYGLNRSFHTLSFNEKHLFTHSFERTLSCRSSTSPVHKNTSSDLFDLEISPPSSPKVKGVVEKSDSVSWVLDLDESPEVLASRMVRRAGSFRSSTPPKNTPKHSPAIKRARTKSNTLCTSASSSAILPSTKSDRLRSKSMSLRDKNSDHNHETSKSWQLRSLRNQKSIDCSDTQENLKNQQKNGLGDSSCQNWQERKSEVMCQSWDGDTVHNYQLKSKSQNSPDLMCKSWHYCTCTSSPISKQKNNQSSKMHECDLVNEVNLCLPKLPSEISRPNDCCSDSYSCSSVKNAAGEAMISESNSEDEFSSSIEEQSPNSLSDTENSEENNSSIQNNESDNVTNSKKRSKQYDLFVMTESTNTNSEEILGDFSSSEELES